MTARTTAILAIDLQNEYREGAAWPVVGYDDILASAAALMTAGRAAGLPVIHAQAWVTNAERGEYVLQDETIADAFRSGIAGSRAAAICAEVAPESGDIVLHKHWPSSFRDTDLEARLRALGVDTLIVAGVLTESCVMGTVFDAVYAGFRVWLVKDAIGSMSDAMHRAGFLGMANRLYGGGVLRQAEALRKIASRPHHAWQCTRPVEFVFTMETLDPIYEAL